MEIDELQAGRELDALVAEKVMGWHNITRWVDGEISGRHKQADHQLIELPRYRTDIAAAWKVVECLRSKGFGVKLYDDKTALLFHVVFFKTDQPIEFRATGEPGQEPSIICEAALKAVECSAS